LRTQDFCPTIRFRAAPKAPATGRRTRMNIVNPSSTANRWTAFTAGGLSRARQQASAREFLTTVFRDWWLMAATFVAVAVVFALAAIFIQTTYTAQSRLLVLFSREYSAQAGIGEAPSFLPDQSQIVRNEMELLTSPLIAEQVLEDLGVETIYPDLVRQSLWNDAKRWLREVWGMALETVGIRVAARGKLTEQRITMNAAVQRFLDRLAVTPVKDANILAVTFTHPDPELAAGAVNTLVKYYLDERSQIFTQDKTRQLKAERDRFADRLAAADRDLEEFKSANHISAFEDQKTLALRRQAETANDQSATATRLAEGEARLEELKRSLRVVPKDVPLYSEKQTADAADNIRAALLTLKLRRSEMLTKFVENSRYITDLDAQIADLERQLASSPEKNQDGVRTGRNTVYDNLLADIVRQEAEIESLRSRQVSLNGQLAEVNERLSEFDRLERGYNALMLNRTLLEQNLRTYAQKLEEAQIQENLERSRSANVRVIEAAQPPSVGSGTRRIVLALGLLVGLAAAIIVIFLLDATREVLITPETVARKLRLPVLVSIAHRNPPQPPDWRTVVEEARRALSQVSALIRAGG
jgi:uncharacterized protein involved in exopolysaccharide biosynthesis